MAEYIEKQAAIDAVKGRFSMPVDNLIVEVMNAIPPADVRPVVRGRWIPFTSEAAGDIWYCSACGVGYPHHMDFCPHCGADMRGGDAVGNEED